MNERAMPPKPTQPSISVLARVLAGLAIAVSVLTAYASFPVVHDGPVPNPTARVAARYPIHWRLGRIDPRFNLDSDQVRKVVERSAQVWEAESGRKLFVYDQEGGFPVDFVFDKRQETQTALRDAKEELEGSKATLDQARQREQQAMARFREAQRRISIDGDDYNARLDAYNRRVDYWNARGGAPREAIAKLDSERANLDSELSSMQLAQRDAEEMRQDANSQVEAYNDLLERYNLSVNKFNDRFSSPIKLRVGECTMAGTTVKWISIFAFSDTGHLVIVLAHELGHAIGLKHVKGEGSLMSAVEDGEKPAGSLQLTTRDRVELRRVLGQ